MEGTAPTPTEVMLEAVERLAAEIRAGADEDAEEKLAILDRLRRDLRDEIERRGD